MKEEMKSGLTGNNNSQRRWWCDCAIPKLVRYASTDTKTKTDVEKIFRTWSQSRKRTVAAILAQKKWAPGDVFDQLLRTSSSIEFDSSQHHYSTLPATSSPSPLFYGISIGTAKVWAFSGRLMRLAHKTPTPTHTNTHTQTHFFPQGLPTAKVFFVCIRISCILVKN